MKHKVCTWADLDAKGKIGVTVNERTIMVAAFEGKAYAIQDKCPHMGAPLSVGKYKDGIIQCKAHGLKIDVSTGKVVDNMMSKILTPKQEQKSVRTFTTTVEEGDVFIEL